MQLGRINAPGGPDFAVRMTDDEPWIALRDLGIDAQDTSAVIGKWDEVQRMYTQTPAVGADGQALRCPVVRPGKILAIGLNYLDHIRETGAAVPARPVVFAKYPSSLNDPFGSILVDEKLTAKVDYEAELAVIMGRSARRLTRENALDHVFGYAVANDVSARDLQNVDSQFSRSKSLDTFCPIGPWITSADSVGNPQDLRISSMVNGEIRQDSSTGQMLFAIVDLLVYLSSTMTLEPGDVILTGTPPGVGIGHKPPIFLTTGDVVRCSVELLGHIENTVVFEG